jgi:hypothetical protein
MDCRVSDEFVATICFAFVVLATLCFNTKRVVASVRLKARDSWWPIYASIDQIMVQPTRLPS